MSTIAPRCDEVDPRSPQINKNPTGLPGETERFLEELEGEKGKEILLEVESLDGDVENIQYAQKSTIDLSK